MLSTSRGSLRRTGPEYSHWAIACAPGRESIGDGRRRVTRGDWLRFYPTGEVTGYSVWAIARTAEKYTRLRSKGVARGTLQRDGDRVSFQLRGPNKLISYQGVVEADALVLFSDDESAQRHKPSERYGFYPVKKLAPRPDASTDGSKPTPKPRKQPKPPSFGFPPAFDVRKVGSAPASVQGVVIVPGRMLVHVFDSERGQAVLTPPNTVAFVMLPGGDRVAGWRVREAAGRVRHRAW
jgi:hypothetical protein